MELYTFNRKFFRILPYRKEFVMGEFWSDFVCETFKTIDNILGTDCIHVEEWTTLAWWVTSSKDGSNIALLWCGNNFFLDTKSSFICVSKENTINQFLVTSGAMGCINFHL